MLIYNILYISKNDICQNRINYSYIYKITTYILVTVGKL